jgi:hypothetical protein
MKHKHSEMIKAWLDGIECEVWTNNCDKWSIINNLSIFDYYDKVRIKPEPPKEEEPQYLYVYSDLVNGVNFLSPKLVKVTSELSYMGKVRLEK